MVAGSAYIGRVRRLPSNVFVTLQPEKENQYFPNAVAVMANGEKVGYLAPEIARRYYAPLVEYTGTVTCPARRGTAIDHESSGVELLLDFSSLPVQPTP